jgi:hypothetical protein
MVSGYGHMVTRFDGPSVAHDTPCVADKVILIGKDLATIYRNVLHRFTSFVTGPVRFFKELY